MVVVSVLTFDLQLSAVEGKIDCATLIIKDCLFVIVDELARAFAYFYCADDLSHMKGGSSDHADLEFEYSSSQVFKLGHSSIAIDIHSCDSLRDTHTLKSIEKSEPCLC